MKTHIHSLPIIGNKRQLKFAIEQYVLNKYKKGFSYLDIIIKNIINDNINIQISKGLDIISIGGFHFYDIMINTMFILGIVPSRFRLNSSYLLLSDMLKVARGFNGIIPLKMSKWFNTNYHYFAPEICSKDLNNKYHFRLIKKELCYCTSEVIKVVIIGPLTFFRLSTFSDKNLKYIKKKLLKRYLSFLKRLSFYSFIKWVQFDEMFVSNCLTKSETNFFKYSYYNIKKYFPNLILSTNLNYINSNFINLFNFLKIKVLNIDFFSKNNLSNVFFKFNKDVIFSLGIVNGKNIWINNFKKSIKLVRKLKVFGNRIWISSNSSFIHIPISKTEEKLSCIYDWLSFAFDKIDEIIYLSILLCYGKIKFSSIYLTNKRNVLDLKKNLIIKDAILNKTLSNFVSLDVRKKFNVSLKDLGLSFLPITTIGSFPQNAVIRSARKNLSSGLIDQLNYNNVMKNEIRNFINLQQSYNLDVLVHGEPERNDMVEYFCKGISGCYISNNGWVQSYGTRCVKPPIIWGDLKLLDSSVEEYYLYSASLVNKFLKGIVTGPITMLKWSFIREDTSIDLVAYQFSYIINKEIKRLVKSGAKIIQVDEPALKECMPDNIKDRKFYFSWAIRAFRLACNFAYLHKVQVHTHICYSNLDEKDFILFNSLGIDVISIESSKNMEKNINLIKKLGTRSKVEIGLGIYDVHSDNIPPVKHLLKLIKLMVLKLGYKRLWINPDCGFKTKSISDVITFLSRLVIAVSDVKKLLFK